MKDKTEISKSTATTILITAFFTALVVWPIAKRQISYKQQELVKSSSAKVIQCETEKAQITKNLKEWQAHVGCSSKKIGDKDYKESPNDFTLFNLDLSYWKKYQNTYYKFEIEFPSSWEFADKTELSQRDHIFYVDIAGKKQRSQTEFFDGATLWVDVAEKVNKNLSQWVKEKYGEVDMNERTIIYSSKRIGTNNYLYSESKAYGPSESFYVKHGNSIYSIVATSQGSDNLRYNEDIQHMLETFRFLD